MSSPAWRCCTIGGGWRGPPLPRSSAPPVFSRRPPLASARGSGLYARRAWSPPTIERASLGLRPGISAAVRPDAGRVVTLFVVPPYAPTNALLRGRGAPAPEGIRHTTAAAVGPTLV